MRHALRRAGQTMKITWQIDRNDVAEVRRFFRKHKDDAFVRSRIRRNLVRQKCQVSLDRLWQIMIGCLATTRQRVGPNSAVGRFTSASPFPLPLEACRRNREPGIVKVLNRFGLWRSSVIARAAMRNLDYLSNGGWEPTLEVLESVRLQPNPNTERQAARFVDENFSGFGPKQARNLLQWLGLSQFEVPIDSRLTKWLNAFGFPVKLNANALTDRSYFEFVSDGFQQLSQASGIAPCVLDAAIFASFDKGEWTDDNVE